VFRGLKAPAPSVTLAGIQALLWQAFRRYVGRHPGVTLADIQICVSSVLFVGWRLESRPTAPIATERMRVRGLYPEQELLRDCAQVRQRFFHREKR
jgi:hypothetical protein